MIHPYSSSTIVGILVGVCVGSRVIGGPWRDWVEGGMVICSIWDTCVL
jgi:hypothetical protein